MSAGTVQTAALVLEPFALWAAGRGLPEGVPLIVTEGGRVRHADDLAQAAGITPGMRVSGALSRLPTLHAVPFSAPQVAAAWTQVVQDLPAFSPRVEPLGVGRALLTLRPPLGAQLAAALQGRVGLAPTRELALLAALSARPGTATVVRPGEEDDFRGALPLSALLGIGLSPALAERLGWLGLRTVGDLLRWSRAQQAAFLGAEDALLRPYLHGAKSGGVAQATQERTVQATLNFSEPLYEPRDLEPAAAELAQTLLAALAGRRAGRVTLRAQVAGLSLSATREVKEDVREPSCLRRALLSALHDSGAARHGIEGLEVTLGALERPAVQGDLWGRAQARDAAAQAEARFPGTTRRVQWMNIFSLAPTAAFQWVRVADAQAAPVPAGAEPTRKATPSPPPRVTA
ncbi:hypothetical protein [Deinococcus koreensis]|uniref:UmuC domain-containing protein n=1 Tax=Deinococcus koreensis TaxID=2054903 RepID=A0A2K3UXI6_9DEIO|nr:hypothetical protein [Deinococcus koreensis]PNY81246.1 hypothetical protein CVO96_07485 [Deinococcus koreensis]